jgi:tetratricopeptide (TPR) repeat protein
MSLRFRRSMKLIPGVRLTFNKDSLGLSFGVPGARYTMNTKGRRTFSTGLPGTGISHVETLSSSRRSTGTTGTAQRDQEVMLPYETPAHLKPGLFAGKAEREFFKFLLDIYKHDSKDTPSEVVEKANMLKANHAKLQIALDLIIFLHTIGDESFDLQKDAWAETIWTNRNQYFNDRTVLKYFSGITPQVSLSHGIFTQETYNIQTFSFMYAELLQHREKFAEALSVIESIDVNQYTAISVADIEITMKDYDAAIETTEDIENEDDATAMLLILRGIAFREKEMYDGALECFKRALAKKDRSEVMKHRALFERAENYTRMGKKAMAIKDLEKILVDDSDYPAVNEKLTELKT